ncbi:3-hydroxyacyl-CoA dehydrogenase [Mycetocola saprophilus]|uniref:3-hydroxyacyl-CoA dehydrogenase n=1 Tax=Mycetocola saprophilus TaxID=76636 RepID=UPI003BF107A7
MRNITVLGTGVLGSQIVFQTAIHGFPVVAYDIKDAAIEAARTRFAELAKVYARELPGATEESAARGLANISYSTDLDEAVANADLVIEAVPENINIKTDTYTRLAAAAPEHTIFATNSSTLLPSDIAPSTGRPDRFLALHFANRVWIHNTAEIMGSPETDPAVFARVVKFAQEIGMVPIEIFKEKAGYLLNSLLVPLLEAAADLVTGGYATPESVDQTWRVGTGSPMGPFQILDVVGLNTAYNIALAAGAPRAEFAAYLKENFIDKGKLGRGTGEGFYTYPAED